MMATLAFNELNMLKRSDNFPKMFVEQFIFGETAGKDT